MDSARKAQFLAWLVGVVIFIESNITVLVAGSVARPLFDRFKTSREKLAYLIDSTSAPICILIPLNAWGAYNLGILSSLGVENPLRLFLESIVFNFYAIAAVLLALATVIWGLDLGPMKKAEERTRSGQLLWPEAQPMIDEAILSPDPQREDPAPGPEHGPPHRGHGGHDARFPLSDREREPHGGVRFHQRPLGRPFRAWR